MKGKAWSILYNLFFVVLAGFLLYYCFRNIDFVDLYGSLQESNQLMIWLSVLMGFVAYLLRALRWRILIEPLGYKTSLRQTYDALMIGYTINLVLPRVGELTRCAVLSKSGKAPVESLFGTVVTERVIDLLCLFGVIVLTFFLRIDFFGDFLYRKIFEPVRLSLAGIENLIFILFAFLGLTVLALYLGRNILFRIPLVAKLKESLVKIGSGARSIFAVKQRTAFLLYTIGIWVCFWLTSYLVILALPATAQLDPADGLFLMVLGSLGWVIPVPGGMGSFHYIVALGLSIYGVAFEPDGVIFATIAHESQLIPMVILGIISFLSFTLSQRKSNREQRLSNQET